MQARRLRYSITSTTSEVLPGRLAEISNAVFNRVIAALAWAESVA
jgi:hypothetical protein